MNLAYLDYVSPDNAADVPLEELVDKYGLTKAEAADVADDLEAYKGMLIKRVGAGCAANGKCYRVSVSNSARSNTDWQSVALALAKKAKVGDVAFRNLVAEHTNLTEVWRVNCSARIVEG